MGSNRDQTGIKQGSNRVQTGIKKGSNRNQTGITGIKNGSKRDQKGIKSNQEVKDCPGLAEVCYHDSFQTKAFQPDVGHTSSSALRHFKILF